MKTLSILGVALLLLSGCGTMMAFHMKTDVGLILPWISLRIITSEFDLYRQDTVAAGPVFGGIIIVPESIKRLYSERGQMI